MAGENFCHCFNSNKDILFYSYLQVVLLSERSISFPNMFKNNISRKVISLDLELTLTKIKPLIESRKNFPKNKGSYSFKTFIEFRRSHSGI